MFLPLNECAREAEHGTRGHASQENMTMDQNRIIGAAKQAKGAVKRAIGKAAGDANSRAEGNAGQAEGTVQNAIGGLNDAVRDALTQ